MKIPVIIDPPRQRGEGVVVGMSGGVDSSIAAFLLREAGFRVVGVTFRLYPPRGDGGKDSREELAGGICRKLGIEHQTVDLSGPFEEKVISDFTAEYGAGRTPNPCIICNEKVKFPSIAALADRLGIERIATGHYAALSREPGGKLLLATAADRGKDQAYFLYRVPVGLLERTIFPLGTLRKSDVRRCAADIGIRTAVGRESQDVCFLDGGDLAGFLSGRVRSEVGEVVDSGGKVLGMHNGVHRYTIGQRRGLAIAGPEPLYVGSIDADLNRIVLVKGGELFCGSAVCGRLRLRERVPSLPLSGRIRYRHPGACIKRVSRSRGELIVKFAEPQRAVTAGQSLVLYRDGKVLGGGIIVSVGVGGSG